MKMDPLEFGILFAFWDFDCTTRLPLRKREGPAGVSRRGVTQ